MLAANTRFYILALFFLILLDGRKAWRGLQKDKQLLMDLSLTLVHDIARKAEPMWHLKNDYSRYKTYAIAEKIYIIRSEIGRMVRVYLRTNLRFSRWSVTEMIRNLTNLQRMGQQVFLFLEELERYDNEIMNQDKIRNVSRIKMGESCQSAGTMFIPESVLDKYRRQIVDGRREHIVKTYLQEKPLKLAEHVAKEISESLQAKPTRGPTVRNQDSDFMDLAPDFK